MKGKGKSLILSLLIGVVFIAGLVLYQKWAIAKEVNLKTAVFAQVDIPPRTEITEEMLSIREVSGNSIPPNAILNPEDVVGKYTADGFGVVQNTLLLGDKFISFEDLPDAGILDLNPEEEAFPLLVDLETSLGNSIMPQSNVDLYFRGVVKERVDGVAVDRPIFGKLASHVRVTSAKDTQAINVFEEKERAKNSDNPITNQVSKEQEARSLTKLYIFAVSNEENQILNKGKMIGEIIPVATGKAYDKDVEEEEVEEEELIKYIEEQAFKIKKVEKEDEKE